MRINFKNSLNIWAEVHLLDLEIYNNNLHLYIILDYDGLVVDMLKD